jgi:hypothetical protein
MATGYPGTFEAKRHTRCLICGKLFGYYPTARPKACFCSYACRSKAWREFQEDLKLRLLRSTSYKAAAAGQDELAA